jgi:tetratricopeptide (TPR) repeat protein
MTRPTQSTNITNGSTSLNPALKSVLSLYQDGQYEQALAKLNTMEKTADPAALAAAKAEIYMAMDKLDLAVAGFRQAYQAQPDRYAERYAVALLRSNNPDDALDILQKASARQPNNANIAWLIGCIYQQVGLPNQGIPYLKKAIALNPKSGDLAFTLGLAYELQGDPMTAKNHYAQAVTLNPSDSEAKQSLERVKSMAKLGTATQ